MKPSHPKPIRVRSSAGDYRVLCHSGLLQRLSTELEALGGHSNIHFVTSPRVWEALGKTALDGFRKKKRPQIHLLDDHEAAKTLSTVENATRLLVRAGADRHSLIIAMGGGVVGDVAGFVAATYLRGVSLVQVPTTLVAQVDSSVGGKTGVNLPEGKNLVGAFYPAKLVVVDPEALATLPDREYRGGLAEVIKYGIIADPRLFKFLEDSLEDLLKRDAGALLHILRRSIEIKADVVSRDERESSLREILNFGHTFGHALESVTKYQKYQHGEAVALGMICAGLLGHEAAGTPADEVARIITLIRRIGPLPGWPKCKPETLIKAMRSDKKSRGGEMRFVLAPRIGRAKSYDGISEKTVMCVLRFMANHAHNPEKTIGKCDG